jgi:hypothetical membrane protein
MEGMEKAGFVFMCGAIILLFGIMLAEFIFEGYSVSNDWISDLGANAPLPGMVFNASIVLFGISALYSANLFRKVLKDPIFSMLIFLAGTGAIIVGIFNVKTIVLIHYSGALMAFIFGAGAIIYSTKVIYKSPLSYFWILLGIMSFVNIAFLVICWPLDNNCFGFGYGSVERLILYPIIVWSIATGAYIMASDK